MSIGCFIAYGNWNPKVPTNPYLIPNALAKCGQPVIFVKQELWNKSLSAQPWAWNKLDLRKEGDCIWVLTLHPPLPRKGDYLQNWFVKFAGKQIKKAAEQIGFREDELCHLLFSPVESYALDWLPHIPFVYRVIDDYASMPYYARDPEAALKRDESLASRALAVFPSNPKLFEAKKPLNSKTMLVPNGVNFEHFSTQGLEIPEDMEKIPKPRIGFAGAVDRYKVDFDLLAEVASARPEWNIILIGEVGTEDGTLLKDLPQLPNMHYLGFRPYSELPNYMHRLDVGIIPYVNNSYTQGVSPLKLYEYFAAGLPVISTTLPFVEAAGDAVWTADTPTEMVKKIELALEDISDASEVKRVELARANSWESRAKMILDFLD